MTLPERISPIQNLKYTIEGIIDIVREVDKTWMYDLKTHDRFSIENNRFTAPPTEKLFEKEEGERNIFAVRVCRNCDSRFSCDSFREYVRQSDRGNQGLRKYLDDYGTDFSTEDFIEGNLLE